MFKIIAIRTGIREERKYHYQEDMSHYSKMCVDWRCARYDSVMRILKPDTVFWFHKGYSFDAEGNIFATENVLNDSFFNVGNTNISVNAIVGENGMGKSSLIELAFRMLNNTSYALKDGLVVQGNALHFIRDIYATLWYEHKGEFFCIRQQDGVLNYSNQSHPEDNWKFDIDYPEQHISIDLAKQRLAKLFYTIVINYSQFAYNPSDYKSEWDDIKDGSDEIEDSECWLTSLFHKNDGYQTPIVLNPYREKGNININVERELTQSRLYKLVLADHSPLRNIFRNKDVYSFLFDIVSDLNPIPTKRYCSKRVFRQLLSMRLIRNTSGTIDYKTINNVGRRIVNAWGHALGYSIEEVDSAKYWSNMDDVRTINYIVYKTLKISATYAKYYKYHDCFQDMKQVQKYVSELRRDNSHVTLKIRRCIAYLFFHHYNTGVVIGGHVNGNEMLIADYRLAIANCFRTAEDQFDRQRRERPIKYDEGDIVVPHVWTEDELLPAPSFRTDMIIKDDNGDNVKFSTLSSGEKQMVFSMSTFIYQLTNIDSVWEDGDDGNIKYDSVCVVFDEIELYSHPKYQLMLVNFLLSTIKSLNLGHVQNINIMLVTHSPFILSDLPASNILCLTDGKPLPEKNEVNAFCENVYDILNNQFFMDRFVGDFAADKIDEYIEMVNAEALPNDIDALIKNISLVGDSFLRNSLLARIDKRRNEA